MKWGVVAEVVPNGNALIRAREFGRALPDSSGGNAPRHTRPFR